MQQDRIRHDNRHQALEEKKLYLEEFKLGLITAEEYRRRAAHIDAAAAQTTPLANDETTGVRDSLRIRYPRRQADEREDQSNLSGSNGGEEDDISGDDIEMGVHDDDRAASEIQ